MLQMKDCLGKFGTVRTTIIIIIIMYLSLMK